MYYVWFINNLSLCFLGYGCSTLHTQQYITSTRPCAYFMEYSLHLYAIKNESAVILWWQGLDTTNKISITTATLSSLLCELSRRLAGNSVPENIHLCHCILEHPCDVYRPSSDRVIHVFHRFFRTSIPVTRKACPQTLSGPIVIHQDLLTHWYNTLMRMSFSSET